MRFDVVVVGGGSTGSSIAYYLASRGAGKVALVEKQRVGWGQTGRSTAVVRLHYSTEPLIKMALESWKILRNMEKVVGGPSGFTEVGFLIFAGQEDLNGLKRNVELQKKLGVETRLLGPEEVREILPQTSTDALAAAAYEPHSGYADPVTTAQTYASAAVREGADLLEDCEVHSVRRDGRRILGLETSKGLLEADVIVNATGVWCNRFFEMTGVQMPVKIYKEEIVVWKRPSSFEGNHPVVGDLPNNYYMRPAGETQTYMGSINPDLSNPRRYATDFDLEERVGIETATRYGEAVSKRFPVMAEAGFVGGWVGLYDVTPDWLPVIGFSQDVENLFNAVGMSGHGFKLCPAIGILASDIIMGKKTSIIDPQFLHEKRFTEQRYATSSYRYGVIS